MDAAWASLQPAVPGGWAQCLISTQSHASQMNSRDPYRAHPKQANWLGFSYHPEPPSESWGIFSSIRILTERFSRLSNITWTIRNGLRSPFKKPELKLFTDLFLWELSGRKEPSQTCSQERDYQKDENNMKQQQISHEYHSSRRTTFVSYLRKSGFKQNNYWREFALMTMTTTTGTSKTFSTKAVSNLITKYRKVLEVMIPLQLKAIFTKYLLSIRNCLALIWTPGEGNGAPLQYSCLGNPMDGGAW